MSAPPRSRRLRLLRFFRVDSLGDLVFKLLTGGFALLIIAVFLYFLRLLIDLALPAFQAFGWDFPLISTWDPPGQIFGAYPYIYGTFFSSLLALLFAVPIAVGTAIALTELLHRNLATPLGLLVELLAAVPSIIYGIWGFAVVVPWVRRIGGEQTFGPSLLAAGIVLAVMILPIITSVARDVLRAVPRSQREAAYALGLTRWEVTSRVVLPNARSGIIAAVILGFGRALGETMAVIMVIGNQPLTPRDVFEPASTIASVIANEFGDPSGPLHFAALVELGLILLLMSLVVNLAARIIVHVLQRRVRGAS